MSQASEPLASSRAQGENYVVLSPNEVQAERKYEKTNDETIKNLPPATTTLSASGTELGGSRKPRKTRRHRKTHKHKPMKRKTRNKPRKTRKT
jgi:hypothetical protein